jgi:hypothetical protein
MHVRLFRILTVGGWLLVSACSDCDHLNFVIYEYRYINGAFVGQYKDFLEGAERANWKCYDGKSKHTFDCTFARGGWDQFQYIYRTKAPS